MTIFETENGHALETQLMRAGKACAEHWPMLLQNLTVERHR